MKVAGVGFDIPGRGAPVALGPPPGGGDESQMWSMRGEVVQTPACFPLSALPAGGSVRVMVELHADSPPATRIWVRATPLENHVLGEVPEIRVDPGRWTGNTCAVSINVDAGALRAGGVDAHHAVWRWQSRSTDEPEPRDLGFSEHLLFVTVSPPTDPWTKAGVSSGSLTRPWMAALAQACRWGRGAKTRRQAASRIVQSLFALGGASDGACLRYMGESTEYLDPGIGNPRWFDCEQFLKDLDTGDCLGINCFEGATIVVTFANLLGCELVPCMIEGDCLDLYDLNRVQSLGIPSSQSPEQFVFHAVAREQVKTPALGDDRVYDATLMIDRDSRPSSKPVKFGLADGIRLGTPKSRRGRGAYFPQLIAKRSIDRCRARTVEPPRVGARPEQDSVEACALSRYESYRSELESVIGPPASSIGSWAPTIQGYTARAIYEDRPGLPRRGLPRQPRTTRLLFTPDVPGRGHAIRLDWWRDDDPRVTVSFMAELLAMIEVRVERVTAGAVTTYTGPSRTSLLVIENGVAARFASAGRAPVDMVDIYQRGQIVFPARVSSPVAVAPDTPAIARIGPRSQR